MHKIHEQPAAIEYGQAGNTLASEYVLHGLGARR
jgi:hypothetical protein